MLADSLLRNSVRSLLTLGRNDAIMLDKLKINIGVWIYSLTTLLKV